MSISAHQIESKLTRRNGAYAWYVIAVSTVAYVFSFIDRQVLALLVEPVRADLGITDTQFSFLQGLAFALFYAIMGVPIARWADKHSRPAIIGIGICLWSVATALCGTAKSFFGLFMARVGVGIGEACLSPAVYSMAADLFPSEKLGRALGVYSTGAFIGSGLALIVGGAVIGFLTSLGETSLPLVGEVRPWRLVFFIVGIPGVLVGLLVLLTIRDPERKGVEVTDDNEQTEISFGQVLGYVRQNQGTFTTLFLGFSLYALTMMAYLSWTPAYYIRTFGLSPAEIGPRLGMVVMIANTTGVLAGGSLGDFLAKRGHLDATHRVGVLGCIMLLLPGIAFPFIKDFSMSLVVLGAALFFSTFAIPTAAAALQLACPNRMRARVSALFILCMSLIAMTLGPLLVALITDYVFQTDSAVGWSLTIVAATAVIGAAILLALGARYYRETIARMLSI